MKSAILLILSILGSILPVSMVEAQAQNPAPIVEEEIYDEGESTGGLDLERGDLGDLEAEAQELFAEDDLEGALVVFRKLAERHSEPAKKAEMLLFVAWIEHLAYRDEAAYAVLTEALLVQPDLPFRSELFTDAFRDLFLEAQSEALEKRDLAAFEAVERGLDSLRQRDYAAAREAFEEALEARSDHPQAIYNLALANLYDRRHDDAMAGFQKLLALSESRSEEEISAQTRGLALANMGYLYNHRRLSEEAEVALERSVELYAQNASAWSNLGVSRRRLGKKIPAADAFRRAHELAPDDPVVMNNLALAYIDTQDWVSAVAILKGATERYASNASMWLNFGLAQLGMGNETGAIASFESAISSDAQNTQGWAVAAAIHLANHYLAAGDDAKVLATADRILGWRRDSSEGWSYRGLAQRNQGDFSAARQSLEEARRLDPTDAQTHNNLGSVYFELRELDSAKQAFERALAIDPTLAEARENLAAVRAMPASDASTRSTAPGSGASSSRPPPRSSSPPPSTAPPRAKPPRTAPPPPPPPPRARLGLRFSDIDYSALGIKGVMVESVVSGTLASRAGIQPKDLIMQVDGQDITGPEDLERYIRETDKKSVVLNLLRSNLPTRVEMRLE